MALAIDVGGTKVAAALVTADGDVVSRKAAPTPRTENPEEVFDRILAVAGEAGGTNRSGADAHSGGDDHRVVVCGVGCGGPMTAGGEEVSPLNIASMRGISAPCPAGRGEGGPDVRRQRRQGPGPGRGLAGGGGGL